MHTPYDGSAPPFNIGLRPIAAAEWIEVDAQLPQYLATKARLESAAPDAVFAAEPGTEAAQAEVLALLLAHLPRRFPQVYRRAAQHIDILPAQCRVALDDPARPALLTAAQLVQEDLVLMRRDASDWVLAAGSVCFPSSWRLRDKFGKSFAQVHAPVPGFGAGTRNAALVQRMFDSLRPALVFMRWNWGLYDTDELHHPDSGNGMRRFGADADPGSIFLRVERQTLRRLPQSRHVLFTIRTFLDPLRALEALPQCRAVARAMAAQLTALSATQLAYKGLSEERDRLLAHLERIAAEARGAQGS
jgi:dimethylamine monooxygenase subunit A